MTVDVAIVGGGISGLAAAYALTRSGRRAVVLERQARPGGNAVSERTGGFLMEHGPTTVSATCPDAAALSDSLGLDPLRSELGPGVRYRYLVRDGALWRMSVHPAAFLLSPYLSFPARLRLLAEPLVPAAALGERVGRGDETVAEFGRRRFGREFTDRVIDPLVGGLYAGTADELSMAAVFPSLLEMERRHGSIVRGVLKSRRAGRTMPGRRLFSWRDGVATLPARLAERLGPAVRTGAAVRRIRPVPGGYRVEAGPVGTLTARAVVIATQPHVAAGLLDALDPEGAQAAAAIDAPPLAVVFLGYRRGQVAHALDGLGFLAPSSEGGALTGTLFCSTMFDRRAPEGCVALAAYVGGARAPGLARLEPEDLVALARAELGDLVGARGEPVVARVRQWPRGMPQYRPGHGRLVAALRGAEERRPGLFLAGNYLAGVSVAACIKEAQETAARADRYLERLPRAADHLAEARAATL